MNVEWTCGCGIYILRDLVEMLFVYKFSSFLVFIDSFLAFTNVCCGTLDNDEGQNGNQKYRVDGSVSVPFIVDQSWTANTRVIVDGGQRLAFLRFALIVYTTLT